MFQKLAERRENFSGNVNKVHFVTVILTNGFARSRWNRWIQLRKNTVIYVTLVCTFSSLLLLKFFNQHVMFEYVYLQIYLDTVENV